MARRKLRVLYVEGNGKRGSFTRQSWRQSDIGVGLKRSLPMALLDEIDMRFTSHGHIFDAAHQVDLTDMGKGDSEFLRTTRGAVAAGPAGDIT